MRSDSGRFGPGFHAKAVAAHLPLFLFATILVVLLWSAPALATPAGLDLVIQQAVPTLILSLGLAVVVIAGGDDVVAGGIDMSIPANAVLVSAVMAQLLTATEIGFIPALAVCLVIALAGAAVNIVLVLRIGMTPLLATLGTSVALAGITDWVTTARRINVDDPTVIFLRDGRIAGISTSIVFAAITAVSYWYLVHRTRLGMHLQAVGGNRHAAELAGIRRRPLVALAFLLAGLSAGIAAPFILARGSGYSPGTAENLLLEVVLATFLGAAFSPRRVVTVWGAALGALLVSFLSVGFRSAGVDIFWTGCIKGLLILLVVASASLAKRSVVE